MLTSGLVTGLQPGLRSALGAGGAVITPAALTSGENNADLNTYTTASISVAANQLALLWVVQSGTATEGPDNLVGGTFTGTWTLVGMAQAAASTIALYRYLGAAASGTTVINFDADDTTTGASWAIVGYSGVNTSGTNGAGAIAQFTAGAAGASLGQTITLNAFGNEANMHAYGISHLAAEATTPGTGFNERTDTNHASPAQALETADKINDTTADPSWATSSASRWVAVEIRAA